MKHVGTVAGFGAFVAGSGARCAVIRSQRTLCGKYNNTVITIPSMDWLAARNIDKYDTFSGIVTTVVGLANG